MVLLITRVLVYEMNEPEGILTIAVSPLAIGLREKSVTIYAFVYLHAQQVYQVAVPKIRVV